MSLLPLFKLVTTFVFDMDGVLTDGNLLLTEEGKWLRTMNTKDGFALQLAVRKGFNVVVISGSISEPVEARLYKLGVQDIYQQVKDKAAFLENFLKEKNISASEVLFMGDDVPDYEAMKMAGISCCPADAVSDIKQISRYISPFAGGKGCVRDVIEKVLKLSGNWELETKIAST